MSFHKYPHLESLYKHAEILDEEEVIVTEKLHGTNGRIGYVEGKVVVGSRNRNLSAGDDNAGFYDWVQKMCIPQKMEEKLSQEQKDQGIIFCGEFFGGNIQKEIKYHDEKDFRVFAIRVGEDFIPWDAIYTTCAGLAMGVVPVIYTGKPDRAKLVDLRQGPSMINPKEPREGIVVVPTVPKRDRKGEWMIYKLKSPEFEERASLSHSKPNLDNGAYLSARAFANEFVTEQRLSHVIDHLKEQGTEASTIKEIRFVLEEMSRDIKREGEKQIPENVKWDIIAREITRLTSAMYRTRIGHT
jgi:hypothetical protein